MSIYSVFIQKFYDESPEDKMVGTIECPARFIGNVDITNKIITNIDIPDMTFWIMEKQLGGGNINVVMAGNESDEDYFYFRNIPFRDNIVDNLLPDTVSK